MSDCSPRCFLNFNLPYSSFVFFLPEACNCSCCNSFVTGLQTNGRMAGRPLRLR